MLFWIPATADELSAFYERAARLDKIKGGRVYNLGESRAERVSPVWITFQQVDDYVPPIWPATPDAHNKWHI